MPSRSGPTALAGAVLRGALRRFLDARGFDLAASLAYASLLTIVPLMAAVTFLTSSFFGTSGAGLYRVIRWVVPGAGLDVLDAIQAFARHATTIAGTASIFFLGASLRTFFQIESAAKTIWGTTVHPRRLLARLGVAALVMVFGPIAAGILTSFLLVSGASLADFRSLGFLVTAALLLFLYRILPGSTVRWGPALVASGAAALGLTAIRILFARGARTLVSFQTTLSVVYGPITAIVIFILAVGLAFAILLLGVALAHALQFRGELLGHDAPARTARGGRLYAAVRLLLPLAAAWENDRASRSLGALRDSVGLPEADAETLLARLVVDGLARRNEEGAYALTRPPDEISLWAVARAIGESAPRIVPAEDDPVAVTLREVFARAHREERGVLQGTSLRDLVRPPDMASLRP
jgi:YihY family inner membrane protein